MLAVDRAAKVRVTPLTELVQIRVYRRIPDDTRANYRGDFGEHARSVVSVGSQGPPRDADVLLELLVLHRDKLRRLKPDNEATRRVQNLVEERRKLVRKRRRS